MIAILVLIVAIALVIGFLSALPNIVKMVKAVKSLSAEEMADEVASVQARGFKNGNTALVGIAVMTAIMALVLWIGFYYTAGAVAVYIVIFAHVLARELALAAFAALNSSSANLEAVAA